MNRYVMKNLTRRIAPLLLLLASFARAQTPDNPEDHVSSDLPNYQRIPALSGTLNSAGSSLVTSLINRWSTAFKDIYPDVSISAEGAGSGTALAGLLSGKTQFAPMSRPMTDDESKAFHKTFGYDPLRITVGVDAIAIFVEKNNPLPAISLKELDAIYSSSPRQGASPARHWSDLGVAGPLASQRITPFCLAKDSGAMDIIRTIVFQGGDFAVDLQVVSTTSSAVQGVGADPAAIAFASTFLTTKRTRQVPFIDDSGATLAPSYDNIITGKYPLSRWLYIYLNKRPGKPVDSIAREFLRFALSEEGQRLVALDGNLPLSPPSIKSR